MEPIYDQTEASDNRPDMIQMPVMGQLMGNTIESCYTDTYNRYKDYADKMDAAFADIELLKKVVTEHSEKLQKLA